MQRFLLAAVRLGGQVGLSVVGYSVRDSEPFLGRFPGQADARVWADSTQEGSLTYVTARQAVRTATGVSRVEVATTLGWTFTS